MPDAVALSLPSFVSALVADEHKGRVILERLHPDYKVHAESWRILLDAFEGAGGFLDGTYLFEYPREDTADFETRKQMARYHNYLESLVDLYVRFMWTQGVTRSADDTDYTEWLENVDGRGTRIDDLLKRLATVGLVHGHAGVLVDKTADEPIGQSQADDTGRVIASVFNALSIADWRHDDAGLAAVKLLEAAPAVSIIEDVPTGDDDVQYLLWAREGWARFDADGHFVAGDTPDLGAVPFVVLRPKPSYRSEMLGRPLISNANVIRAMYNRASEEDEVIRAQAFSVLTVEVPSDGNVEDAKKDLGDVIGTAKAIVVRGKPMYQTPDQDVPRAIRENIAYLVQELYRAAHVRHQSAGLQRESGESIRLQYTELNEMLQGFAKALAEVERGIARAYFAWTSATPEQAEARFEAANVSVTYPSEFFLDELITDLEAWAEAIRMDLGETMTKWLKKRAARRLGPDLTPEQLETIDGEIDAMKDEPVPVVGALDMGDPEAEAMRRAAVN